MNKHIYLLVLSLWIGAGLHAQDSRIDAITQHSRRFTGGFLNSDEYLIQLFPSRVFEHGTHATVQGIKSTNVLGQYDYGSAMYVRKDKLAIGTFLNRSVDVGGSVGVISPMEVLLGFKAKKFSAAIIIGVFSIGVKDTITTNPNTFRFNTFGFQPSASYKFSDKSGIDFSVPIIIGQGNNKTGTTINNELGGLGLSVQGRFYSSAIMVPFYYANASLTTDIPAIPQIINDGTSIFFMGLGRTHQINESNLLVYGLSLTNRKEFNTTETAGVEVETATSTTDWGLLLGGEFNIYKNKFKARGSISYDIYNITRSNQIASNIGIPGQAALGLGYDSPHFRVDVAVSNQLMNNGFFFITGTQSAFFPRITLIGRL